MKRNFHSFGLLFFLLILIASQTSARLLATNQAGPDKLVKLNNINIVNNSPSDMEGDESLEKLMGVEECKIGDEECLKRRAIEEVHLDYIYTQHHKP